MQKSRLRNKFLNTKGDAGDRKTNEKCCNCAISLLRKQIQRISLVILTLVRLQTTEFLGK